MTDPLLQHQKRHQYLAMMGVDSWLPRQQLEGAAPSADWVWDFNYPAPEIPFQSAQDAASPSSPESSRTGNARANLRQSMQSLGAAPTVSTPKARSTKDVLAQFDTPAKPAKTDEKALPTADSLANNSAANSQPNPVSAAQPIQATTEEKAAPTFKLGFMRCGEILFIDSLPVHGQQGFSDAHQRLAAAIAKAIDLGWEHDGRAPSQLPWPAFKNAALTQTYADAYATVQHKLSKELAQGGIKYALLMGESAAQML
ncbi:MAG: hypothetical protein ACPGPF_04290, partial [Pontibacterium sp.]